MKKLLALAILVLLAGACNSQAAVDVGSAAEPANSDQGQGDENGTTQADGNQADEAPAAGDQQGAAQPSADERTEDADTESADVAAAQPQPTVDTSSAAALVGADAWCSAAQQIEDNFDELDAANFLDPVALEASYSQLATLLSQIQSIAPPAIAGDVAQIAVGFDVINEAFSAADWNITAVDVSVFDALDEQMETATFNIEKYNFEVCGIGEDPGELVPSLDEGIEDGSAMDAEEVPIGEEPAAQEPADEDPADDEPAPSEPGADPPATTDSPATTLPPGAIDQIIPALVEQGFTETEATCVINRIDITNPEALTDFTQLLAVFTDCGIPIERLAEIGGG